MTINIEYMHHVCMFQVPLTIKGKENAFVLRNRLLLEQSHINPDVCAVINFPSLSLILHVFIIIRENCFILISNRMPELKPNNSCIVIDVYIEIGDAGNMYR